MGSKFCTGTPSPVNTHTDTNTQLKALDLPSRNFVGGRYLSFQVSFRHDVKGFKEYIVYVTSHLFDVICLH